MLNEELGSYLKQTKYCDSAEPLIKNTAIKITQGFANDKDKAVALFNYVRDNILYKFDYWNLKASSTLKKSYGMCTNKNNLLIAMLRAVNIAAGYGILQVRAREYFGPIMLDFFKKRISEESVHIYTQVYLGNKWIKCDPSTDKSLSEKTAYFNYSTELVRWNGFNDAMDKILPEHIISDSGPFDCIDSKLDKKPKNVTFFKIRLANLYLDFLRAYDKRFNNYKERETAFLSWLKGRDLFLYLYLKIQVH
ncbi:MAG: transglutaminase-like domain-containing protein [Candidatus Omnitrophica bacterium]|nr:transglutaminase-like domain-containing protein [Candidatus Omnitrophota bacterium]